MAFEVWNNFRNGMSRVACTTLLTIHVLVQNLLNYSSSLSVSNLLNERSEQPKKRTVLQKIGIAILLFVEDEKGIKFTKDPFKRIYLICISSILFIYFVKIN